MARARFKVRILETFDYEIELGPLTTTNIRTGEEEVILGPRTARCTFKAGTTTTLGTKEAATKFVERSGGKAVLA
jgi:hypothetical protein